MRILVIGGTYFLGKTFVELCIREGHELILVNRGSRMLQSHDEGGGEYQGKVSHVLMDRHDKEALARLATKLQDDEVHVVVDFCAYEKNDVRDVMDVLPKSVRQYVFISTCDVYRRGTGRILDENAEFERRCFGGQEGAYISGKVALEEELRECAEEKGMSYTSIRPVIIYGPGNYAPREGMFFHWIEQAGQILYPEDAGGSFQMVYVEDIAKCILACLGREDCKNRAINVCGDGIVTYEIFVNALRKACGKSFELVSLPVLDLMNRGVPMPFPLFEEESEHYMGDFTKDLGVVYTPLAEGLREAYEFLKQEC